jgi:succinate dehydrogenase hydrophobic anchor subunit
MTYKKHSLLSESWSMLLTYVTALVLVFALTFHLLLQSPLTGVPLDSTLTFGYATDSLTYFKVVFGALLFAGIIHGLSGIRVIALEWFHPKTREWAINLPVVALMAVLLALGSYTLLFVS